MGGGPLKNWGGGSYSSLPCEVGNKHKKQRGSSPPHPKTKVPPEKTRSEPPSPY